MLVKLVDTCIYLPSSTVLRTYANAQTLYSVTVGDPDWHDHY